MSFATVTGPALRALAALLGDGGHCLARDPALRPRMPGPGPEKVPQVLAQAGLRDLQLIAPQSLKKTSKKRAAKILDCPH